MIDDPYKVLGVPPTATMDEVKKAYRQKAKMYHPDMHPDDPKAPEKMNEVNEAYDMIMNPDKYRQRRAEQQAQQQARQNYGGYGGGYGQSQSSAGQGGYGQGQSGYGQGQGGYGNFSGFDFEEIFRQFYGSNNGGGIPNPRPQAGDLPAFTQAVQAINARQFQQAVRILSAVMSTSRNARWYYLSALANYGAGNRVAAWEHSKRACAMEPNNAEYESVKRAIGRDAQNYETTGRGFGMGSMSPMSICASLCLLQLCCPLCRC